ncbi:MAG: outer membrane protein assembly factor BamC [Burkholderiaceae bacterium]|nr:outer membrane protein assembly factor BamC [Burkholderiaceae bacterium]
MDQRSKLQQGILCALALAGLAGCSSFNTVMEPDRIDYKSAAKATKAPSLEVPPDLTQLQRDNRYQVPASGSITAEDYMRKGGASAPAAQQSSSSVAMTALGGMHIERDHDAHWLVVRQSPEILWPQIKDFWQENGFLINIEHPAEGVMETDWAENRAKIPSDFVHETLGKVFDSLWSTGERDKFRTRLERGPDGTTEIYISHQGVEEVVTGAQKETVEWTPRKTDPGLETAFLSRLMARLGNDPSLVKTAVATTVTEAPHAKLVKDANNNYVEVDENFDHSWRRVGLALDRVGFTVEDRDRTQGLYFVRYVDEAKDAQSKGWFSRLFNWSGDDAAKATKYRILVKENGDVSRVTIQNNDGKPEVSDAGSKILSLLNDQLK